MSDPGIQQLRPAKREAQLHYEEGKSPAAWAGSLTSLLGFIIITLGVVLWNTNWTIIYLGCAIVALGAIATLVMKAMGYGTPPRDL